MKNIVYLHCVTVNLSADRINHIDNIESRNAYPLLSEIIKMVTDAYPDYYGKIFITNVATIIKSFDV